MKLYLLLQKKHVSFFLSNLSKYLYLFYTGLNDNVDENSTIPTNTATSGLNETTTDNQQHDITAKSGLNDTATEEQQGNTFFS
jgi:hypothetical protein